MGGFVRNRLLIGAVFGLAAGLASAAHAANLITNGGFETGTFSGWITGANSYPEFVRSSPTWPVKDGNYAGEIAGYTYDPNTLSQTVSDVAGKSYILSFWRYQDMSGGPPVELSVTWDGATIFSELTPSVGNVYQRFTETVVGTGSDTLTFIAANDPAYTYIDDVTLVPEPGTWAMILIGVGAIGARLRFARRGGVKSGVPA